jgi:hypothetical protein
MRSIADESNTVIDANLERPDPSLRETELVVGELSI